MAEKDFVIKNGIVVSNSTFTANSTLVNAAAINVVGRTNTATLYSTTSVNVGSFAVINSTGMYHTGLINAASISIGGGSFTANSTAVTSTGSLSLNTLSIYTTFSVNSYFNVNSTGAYHTGLMNAASFNIGSAYVVNTTGIYHTGTLNVATISLGSNFTVNSTLMNVRSINVYTNTVTIGTGTYFVSNGNVGIGNNIPESKLTVAGIIESTSTGFKFPDGSIQNTAALVLDSATDLEQEAATSNIVFATPGNMVYHPGVAKAFVNFSISKTAIAGQESSTNVSSNWIIWSTAHGLSNGDFIFRTSGDWADPYYHPGVYVSVINTVAFYLHSTYADALTGNNVVNITTDGAGTIDGAKLVVTINQQFGLSNSAGGGLSIQPIAGDVGIGYGTPTMRVYLNNFDSTSVIGMHTPENATASFGNGFILSTSGNSTVKYIDMVYNTAETEWESVNTSVKSGFIIFSANLA